MQPRYERFREKLTIIVYLIPGRQQFPESRNVEDHFQEQLILSKGGILSQGKVRTGTIHPRMGS